MVVVVRMLQHVRGYNPGEPVGLTPADAAYLISKGKAEAMPEEAKKEEKPDPKKVVAAVMRSPVKK